MPNLTILWMITWLWWQQLENLKVNMNRKSITPRALLNQVLLVKACRTKREVANPDPEAPIWEPWSKWVQMQQQLMVAVKGAQNALKKTPWQGSNQGQRRNSQSTSTQQPEIPMAKQQPRTVVWPKIIKLRPGGKQPKPDLICDNCQVWGHMRHEWC